MYVGMITEGGEEEEENMFLRVGRFAASGHNTATALGPMLLQGIRGTYIELHKVSGK